MENDENVVRMEDVLSGAATSEKTEQDDQNTAVPSSLTEKREKQHIPRGKPKSGRIWKEEKEKFSSIIKTRGTRMSFEKKQKLKEDLKRVKEMSRAIKERKRAEKEAKKERRRNNIKRAEENRKKSEIVQVITNTAKIKRMKKKQLRKIEKRDTVKNVTSVSKT
ncbi:coiled-coil domain-containing protein 86 [Pseudomyrmex gracilis]|uniref:coiled-coil domain-containing protein 86 n=1 Tax=Pseudomyrmex gracilis TaxID=219809 RepID=UPI000994BCD1|nr:coiled-coil domain-containing protein 86 [Pseudomyrmex gracilis]